MASTRAAQLVLARPLLYIAILLLRPGAPQTQKQTCRLQLWPISLTESAPACKLLATCAFTRMLLSLSLSLFAGRGSLSLSVCLSVCLSLSLSLCWRRVRVGLEFFCFFVLIGWLVDWWWVLVLKIYLHYLKLLS